MPHFCKCHQKETISTFVALNVFLGVFSLTSVKLHNKSLCVCRKSLISKKGNLPPPCFFFLRNALLQKVCPYFAKKNVQLFKRGKNLPPHFLYLVPYLFSGIKFKIFDQFSLPVLAMGYFSFC